MPSNVLITCGGGFQGLTLIRELREIPDVTIHVADYNAECLGAYFSDRVVQCPPAANPRAYEAFLRDYVSEHRIDLLIPATPYDLEILAALKTAPAGLDGCRIAVSQPELLDTLLDKQLTQAWLDGEGFSTFAAINPGALMAELPCIGRKRRGWGGKEAVVVRNDGDIAAIDEPDSYIWTRYQEHFNEYSIDFCINFQGTVSQPIVRQRQATVGGFSVVMSAATLPERASSELERLSRLIASEGGCGIFNIQIIEDEEGVYRFSDINPRIGTSAVMARHAGRNLCRHLISDEGPVTRPMDIKIVRYLDELVIRGMDLTGVRGVVFDLDDTLIAHKPWILAKVRSVAEALVDPALHAEFLSRAECLVEEGRAFRLYDELCALFELEELKPRMIEAHRNFVPESLEVYPDVGRTLERLKRRYSLGLMTDNPAESQRQKLSRFPYREFFSETLLTDEINAPKLDRRVFDILAGSLGFAPDKLVVIGDNSHRDIHPAIESGYRCAFHIKRPDRLFNTDVANEYRDRVIGIRNLDEVFWHL